MNELANTDRVFSLTIKLGRGHLLACGIVALGTMIRLSSTTATSRGIVALVRERGHAQVAHYISDKDSQKAIDVLRWIDTMAQRQENWQAQPFYKRLGSPPYSTTMPHWQYPYDD